MKEPKWVAGWGASTCHIAQCHADYVKDQTFRYVFFPTMNASALRLHFSNEYGTEPITITKTVLAISTRGECVEPSTNTSVTFNGKASLTLGAGERAISDEIPFSVVAGKEFDVSMYFADFTHLSTGHSNNGYFIKNFYAKGDHTEKAEFPLTEYGENGPYVFLHTIDFLTNAEDDCKAIIAFGDSITAQPWPDFLAHRMYELGITNRAVIRRGIGGNRVLRDYKYRIKKHWGVRGIERFERDVVQAGADRIFLLHGINDLIHPGKKNRLCPMSELPSTKELVEEGYIKYIEIAHAHGMKIYLSTILPCPRCLNDDGIREQIRCEVNAWIRTNDLCDGIIDFEAAVWDDKDHRFMRMDCDSGDHLHPSLNGAQTMAYSIPEELFRY